MFANVQFVLSRLAVVLTVFSAVMCGPAVAVVHAQDSQAADRGSIGIRLLEAPANNRDDPRARVYIVDHLAPGATITRRLEVSNTTDRQADIRLYASAASIEQGRFTGAAGTVANELTTWTTIAPSQVAVPPESTAEVTATIAVPRDAPPGEQYGVIWAEVRSKGGPEAGVTQISRVGIRLYVSVGAGNPPAADFAIDSLTAVRTEDGLPVVHVNVRNTGGRALDLNGALHLSDGPGGLSAGPIPMHGVTTVGPGSSGAVTAALDHEIPRGPWHATVTLESGLIERTAEAPITFPESGESEFAVSNSRTIPLIGLALTGCILAVGALVVARQRRATRSTRHE
ncbi:DUF916 domain-containing protein [Rhodococcus sp. DMU2021]|uniref:DUF916 domain-containing protein n=1 Tax=Rhodococcus sp. DMU2021 TaxID=2866997 RepID=UPI001C7CB04B|nr:DUF916 domain-containing protein [Rhodococcus sp. DMU2021]MBX4171652.1 DUF916 domain-containing protein [Rhodococcus sp. DMU2021]